VGGYSAVKAAATPSRGLSRSGQFIQSRFVDLAVADPGRPAVSFGDQCLSYGQLLESSQRVAAGLTDLGLAPGSRVGIIARRHPSLVIQLIGILLAECQFTILDRTYPSARRQAMVDACRPHAVLDEDELDKLDLEAPVAVAQDDQAGLAGDGLDFASLPAYLSFTSGTTGTPKCVQGGHAAVVHYLTWSAEKFDLRAGDRFSMISGLSHDPLIRDVFSPLSLGAQLLIPDLRTWANPAALATWMRERQITVTHLTPTMARRVLIPGQASLPDLRRVILGGEVVRVGDLHSFAKVASGARFTVVYGCTETPQVMMHHTITSSDIEVEPAALVPLGDAAPGVDIGLVSSTGLTVPAGERGELVVRTPYLAFGYLRRDGDGLRREPFGRQYATGDLAYRDSSGCLLFAGRSDRQVKIRGARVELDEVEHCLRSCPGVLVAAVAVDSLDDGPALRATVVLQPDVALTERELKRHLAKLLPAPAMPSTIAVLDQIPMSPNGKINLD
jgi:amino acid adenylation domain-containing protein